MAELPEHQRPLGVESVGFKIGNLPYVAIDVVFGASLCRECPNTHLAVWILGGEAPAHLNIALEDSEVQKLVAMLQDPPTSDGIEGAKG